ncbi:hypothetical protein AVEN_18148-1 [Araneus ventricosus]|uniref:Uncharacterized protein n=1 Tax=Araneus ventricosus TaxID=182803 RepID=A0A4Y2AIM0_ARAVE|nr:hypothetical protein AVEN_18148-1 [Araneus ventricosus]
MVSYFLANWIKWPILVTLNSLNCLIDRSGEPSGAATGRKRDRCPDCQCFGALTDLGATQRLNIKPYSHDQWLECSRPYLGIYCHSKSEQLHCSYEVYTIYNSW